MPTTRKCWSGYRDEGRRTRRLAAGQVAASRPCRGSGVIGGMKSVSVNGCREGRLHDNESAAATASAWCVAPRLLPIYDLYEPGGKWCFMERLLLAPPPTTLLEPLSTSTCSEPSRRSSPPWRHSHRYNPRASSMATQNRAKTLSGCNSSKCENATNEEETNLALGLSCCSVVSPNLSARRAPVS